MVDVFFFEVNIGLAADGLVLGLSDGPLYHLIQNRSDFELTETQTFRLHLSKLLKCILSLVKSLLRPCEQRVFLLR